MNISNNKKYFIAILTFLILPISGLSIDIYVPSLPAVSTYFAIDKALVQLSITTYMIGLACMQLFAGGISDSFGRKKPFNIAMTIYIIVTLLVPFSQDIYQLLFLRLIQGLAVGITVVPMRSVTSDLFEGRELKKMVNYMTMAWSIGPIVAPAIGGYLQHYFGWQSNFYFLALYSIFVFSFAVIYIPETSKYRHAFKFFDIMKRYREILFHWSFFSAVLINGLVYSIIILFGIVGPFLIQNVLHYSAIEFGQFALLMGFAWFMGTTTNRFLIDIPLSKKSAICLWSMLFISIIMLVFGAIMPLNIYNIVIPILFLLLVGGILYPNYFALNFTLFPKATGTANALFGSFIFLIAGISSAFGTLLKSTSEIPLAASYMGLIILCLLIHYFRIWKNNKYISQTPSPKNIPPL